WRGVGGEVSLRPVIPGHPAASEESAQPATEVMMMLTLGRETDSNHVLDDALNARLDQFNMHVTGETDWTPLAFTLRDDAGRLRGGILADIWGGWMFISALYVDEDLRGEGWGRQLLHAAEAAARQAGCRNIHLDTFSFQARPFYEKEGYTVFAALED